MHKQLRKIGKYAAKGEGLRTSGRGSLEIETDCAVCLRGDNQLAGLAVILQGLPF